MAETSQIDASKLKALQDPAAGHDGVLMDESEEMIVKPCTQAEVDFYQECMSNHAKFYELMPTYMGTLTLGGPAVVPDFSSSLDNATEAPAADGSSSGNLRGKKLETELAVVLSNLEFKFKKANVLDLKLGSKLYQPGTDPEKAARLDKVASETTSSSLNFRIAGMKVWNGQSYDSYDKFYGRKFTAENVQDGFATFFSGLDQATDRDDARELLETILAEITKVRHSLERSETRMFSSSILIIYEGDPETMKNILGGGGGDKTPRVDERHPTTRELEASKYEEALQRSQAPPTHRIKMIDFAHASWTPGQGRDDNVIKGLKNIEDQMDQLIARYD